VKRDSIFYQIFKQSPSLLFELVEEPPPQAQDYQFESIEVKETAFRMDGVFTPPDNAASKTVFFAEVQFQADPKLYYRFNSEVWLFLRHHIQDYDDWFGVIIFPSRKLEPSKLAIHRSMLNGGQLQRVYLDELGDLREQPLGIGLMLLTMKEDTEAVESAQYLIEKATEQSESRIIDLVTTIIVYKFENLSQEEIQAMLGLGTQEPRAIREAKAEARQEEAQSLVRKQLNWRLGEIPEELLSQIQNLSLEQTEALAQALLGFDTVADLEAWLPRN